MCSFLLHSDTDCIALNYVPSGVPDFLDPDSDNEVKLRFPDGSSSSFLSVTKIALASKQQIEKYDAEVA